MTDDTIKRRWKLVGVVMEQKTAASTYGSYREAEGARLDLPEEVRHLVSIVPVLPWANP